jgi:hypothetical protein
MRNYMQYAQFAVTLLVLIVTATIGYERQNTVNSTDIALIKANIQSVEKNVIELKNSIDKHIDKCDKINYDFEKRIITLETSKADNTRIAYSSYYLK